jgi:hypothetical protein
MRSASDDGAPTLLAMFVLGTLTVLGAVVAVGRIRDGWADAGAIVIVLVLTVALGLAIARQLDDEDDR